ncbi:hypothetical protein X975_21206, partial [Stegodyphus mimosarum]
MYFHTLRMRSPLRLGDGHRVTWRTKQFMFSLSFLH